MTDPIVSKPGHEKNVARTKSFKLALVSGAGVPVTLAVCLYLGAPLLLAGLSALFVILGVIAQRSEGTIANIGASQALVGQAIVLNAAFAGHAWQIDMHMLYFALLAVTIVLYDVPAILAATALIALHHLTLTFVMPSLVFPSTEISENLPRTLVHAVIVLTETAALSIAVVQRKRLDAQTAQQNEALMASSVKAEAAQSQAEALLAEAEQAKAAAEQAKNEAHASLERAEAETERARKVDQEARSAREREEQSRAEAAEKQRQIVDELRKALRSLLQKDLSIAIPDSVPAEYLDLKDDFNGAVEALRTAIKSVRDGTERISNEANAVAGASQEMSLQTESQAGTLAEISSKLSELSNSVSAAALNAREAQKDAGVTQSDVESSSDLVRRAVSAMGGIEESSQQISKIVSVIDEISFQTNLLALNAGVEAARAGESGKGFAVVASEVRSLAQRSTDAAQEIKGLIEESDTRVKEGVGLVRRTGEANETVLAAVSGIVQRILTIAESSETQSTALGEINSSLSGLDNVTQRNAASFEETSAASQVLVDGMRGLQDTVAQFGVEVGAEEGRTDTRKAPHAA